MEGTSRVVAGHVLVLPLLGLLGCETVSGPARVQRGPTFAASVGTAGRSPVAPTRSLEKEEDPSTDPTSGDAVSSEDREDGPNETGPAVDSVQGHRGHEQTDWGIAAVVRTADIPFAGTGNSRVSSFVPMMFYEGDRFFLRGLAGGFHLWENDDLEVNALARARFFDIPAELQNEIQGDTADVGLQLMYGPSDHWVQGEWMTDRGGRQHVNASLGSYQRVGKFELIPSLTLRYKTRDFNDYYFALTSITNESAGSGWELKPNLLARYHVWSDLYLIGSAGYTLLDAETRDLSSISGSGLGEVMLGFGFFQHRSSPGFLGFPSEREGPARQISTAPYVRLAHGWATPSSLADILRFDWEDDEFDNQLTSIFYGHPLTDELFGIPMDVYLTPGFVAHHSSDVQDAAQEYVLAIKLYYTIHWPTKWRIGAAEGLSWISDVTYIERTSLEEKGYKPSDLMNYLDFSLDLNVGGLVHYEPLEKLWVGWSVHHRSSIFESASQFGRIKGGSNYNTVYLQYDIL